MASGATILKAELNISDMDRHYYGAHSLTVAQHPSETEARLMLRLLAFAIHGHEDLSFTKGISTDDEPDLWQKTLTDEIELWVDLGQPDEKRIRKACGRAKEVVLYNYSGHADPWWKQNADKLERYENLSVYKIDDEPLNSLSALVRKNMQLQFTIQDGEVLVSDSEKSLDIKLSQLK